MADRTCSISGCDRKHEARGWCEKHYSRWRTHGDPHRGQLTPSERFWPKVDKGECWLWRGATAGGYGRFFDGGRVVEAHRFAYEQLVGAIPVGMVLDHLCRVRACVNPDHLEVVTEAENIRRGEGGQSHRRKAHCPSGHPYDEVNTRMYRGHRYCRECTRVASREYKRRKRAAAIYWPEVGE